MMKKIYMDPVMKIYEINPDERIAQSCNGVQTLTQGSENACSANTVELFGVLIGSQIVSSS